MILKQKLTLPLILLLIVITCIIAGFFLFDMFVSQSVQIKNIKIDTKAALKLNIMKQISKKNGIREWELTALSATLLKEKNKAILDDVSIIFFTKNNKLVFLKAKNGILDTKSHDMTFSNNVVLTYENAKLTTEKLHYNKKKHIIKSDDEVFLEKKNSNIKAASMEIKLNKNLIIFKGNIKANLSRDFNIG